MGSNGSGGRGTPAALYSNEDGSVRKKGSIMVSLRHIDSSATAENLDQSVNKMQHVR